MNAARTLLRLLPDPARGRLKRLLAVMVAGSLLEAVGIGLILPYLEVVTAPWDVFANQRYAPILDSMGIESWNGLILMASGAMLMVFVVKNGFIAYQWHRVYGFIYRQTVELSRRLLEGYLKGPYAVHGSRNTAELIRNTTSEPKRALDGALRSVLEALAELVVVAGLVVVLFVTHTAAASVVLGLLAVLGWGLTAAFRNRLAAAGEKRSQARSHIIGAVSQSMGGVKEVKVLGREDRFLEVFEGSADDLADALRHEAVIRKYPRLLLETGAVAVMIALAGVIVFTGAEVRTALPVVGVFGVATVRLMPSVKRVVDNVNQLRYQTAAIDTLAEEFRRIHEHEKEGAPASLADAPPIHLRRALEVDRVRYTHPGADDPAVRGVSFPLRAGQSVGLVGASGAGKTTLINLILGLLRPDEGDIRADGVSIVENVAGWQRRLGYIPQDVYLLDATIAENVAFGLPPNEIDEERVWRALEAAHLAEHVRGLEAGLGTPTGERGVRLSGGQRQRVAIARALYRDPEMLVLDEATSALDYATEDRVMKAVRELAGEKTIVMATHRLRSVRRFDRIHQLEEGRVVDSGTFDELVEESRSFRRMARRE